MMQRIPMTPRGKRILDEKLHNLKAVERPKNIEDIEIALAHGDLSENAEYKFAKDRQGEIVFQIRYCENQLALAQVIDPTKLSGDRVIFGATVELVDLATDEEFTYKIVGKDEADVNRNLLSVSSPISKGLIGKEEGDIAKIRTPKGVRELEILSVELTADYPAYDEK